MISTLHWLTIFFIYAGALAALALNPNITESVPVLATVCITFFCFLLWYGRRLRQLHIYLRTLPPRLTVPFLCVQLVFLLLLALPAPTASTLVSWFGLLLAGGLRQQLFPQWFRDTRNRQALRAEQTEREAAFRRVRAERHDFLKHVNVLQHLLTERKHREAEQYIDALCGEYTKTNASLKGEAGHIAAILLRYATLAERQQIALTYDLRLPLSQLPLPEVEQSKLLANLLANSFEAADKVAEEVASKETNEGSESVVETTVEVAEECTSAVTAETVPQIGIDDAPGETSFVRPAIALSTEYYSGIYILTISNTTLPIASNRLDSLFKTFQPSEKGGEHEGLGTFIIADIVARHRGKLSFTYEPPLLTIKIKLPIVVKEHQ